MARDSLSLRPFAAGCALTVAALAAGCGGNDFTPAKGSAGSGGSGNEDPPADVAGEYTVSITNGKNTCTTVTDWTEGQQSTGIPVTITQSGTKVTAEAGGVAAVTVVVITGDNDFVGEIHGNDFSLVSYGTRASTAGNCTYTVNATITGTVDDDSIEGTVTYKPAISDNPDCAPYDCQAEQAYSGSRPPPA